MAEAAPGDLRAVNQAVHGTQVDEDPEVGDVHHGALHHLAGRQALQEGLLGLLLLFLQKHPAGEEHPSLLAVELNDLGRDLLAQVGVQVRGAPQVQLGGRDKGLHAIQVGDHAPLDLLLHRDGDRLPLFVKGLDLVPVLLGLHLLAGKEHLPRLGVHLDHLNPHGVPRLQEVLELLLGEGLLRELVEGDDALGLCADVHRHAFGTHQDHRARQDLAGAHPLLQAGLGLLKGLFHAEGLFWGLGRLFFHAASFLLTRLPSGRRALCARVHTKRRGRTFTPRFRGNEPRRAYPSFIPRGRLPAKGHRAHRGQGIMGPWKPWNG